MLIIVLILLLFLALGFQIQVTTAMSQKRREKLRDSTLVEIKQTELGHEQLLLGKFGVFLEINSYPYFADFVVPSLTKEGDVEYSKLCYPVNVTIIPKEKDFDNPVALKNAKEIAVLVQEKIRFVEPEILDLRERRLKFLELLELITSSEIHSKYEPLCRRALLQIDDLLQKAEELREIYASLIREALIAQKIEDLSRYFPEGNLLLDSQLSKLKGEYRELKETSESYAELLQIGRLELPHT